MGPIADGGLSSDAWLGCAAAVCDWALDEGPASSGCSSPIRCTEVVSAGALLASVL